MHAKSEARQPTEDGFAGGNTFGEYELIAELGQGGMADVLLAVSRASSSYDKLVVLKKLRSHLAEDPEFVRLIVEEASLAARLAHGHVVRTYDAGTVNDEFFMAMEYLEGQPLTRVLRRAQRHKADLPLLAHLRILIDVLDGLHYAHELKDLDGRPLEIVHRDISPANVFVTYDGVAKVVDFGIAKAAGRATQTEAGVVKGRMSYMAPEQASGQSVDRRADIFSVGVMLWEAATGRRMWQGLDEVVILGRLLRRKIPASPRDIRPDVDPRIDAICRRALEADADRRYPTARDFQSELERYLDSRGGAPSTREVGALVATLFEADRKSLRQLIDTRVLALRQGATSGGKSLAAATIVSPDDRYDRLDVSPTRRSSVASSDAFDEELRSSHRPKRFWFGAAVAAAAAALVGGAAWLTWPSAPSVAPAPSVAAPSSAAASPVPPPEPAVVRISLRASPDGAEFSIDDGPWIGSPHESLVPRDDSEHLVRVRAKGHESESAEVSFERDVLLSFELKPSRRRVVWPASPPPTSTPPAEKPVRPLLNGDPWAD